MCGSPFSSPWIDLYTSSDVVVMGRSPVHCPQTEGHLQHRGVWAPDKKVSSFQSSRLCDQIMSNSVFFLWKLLFPSPHPRTRFFWCSKNANNSESEVVLYELEVAAMTRVILQGWACISTTSRHRVCRCNRAFPFQRFTSRQTLISPSELEPESESEGGAGHRPCAPAGLRGTVCYFSTFAGCWCCRPSAVLT